MPILKPIPGGVRPSEITSRSVYLDRRSFLAGGAAAALLPGVATAAGPPPGRKLEGFTQGPYRVDDKLTGREAVTSYNNFIELGAGKTSPADKAEHFKSRPWTVKVDGFVDRPGTIGIEDLLKLFPLEERIYRLRCVETWSMVIPWIGFPLAPLLKRFEPMAAANYVAFESIENAEMLPRQSIPLYPWPYREGLRLDEALHPLAFLAVGLYGEELPAQNGAPLRLIVPWKYGFKSIKSIVRITLTQKQPHTLWNDLQPEEYGFYANVNPDVEHPRWSQDKERRIGEFFRRKTLPFNGYAEEVAGLYAGMDLKENY